MEIGGAEYCVVERRAILSNPLYRWEYDRLGRSGWQGTKRLLPLVATLSAVLPVATAGGLVHGPMGSFVCLLPMLLAVPWAGYRFLKRWGLLVESGMLRELVASGQDPFVLWHAFRHANLPPWWGNAIALPSFAGWAAHAFSLKGVYVLLPFGVLLLALVASAVFKDAEFRWIARSAGGPYRVLPYVVPLVTRLRSTSALRATAVRLGFWLVIAAILVAGALAGGVSGAVIGGLVAVVILLVSSFFHARGESGRNHEDDNLDPREAILRDIGQYDGTAEA